MIDEIKRQNINQWFEDNGIPKNQWEYLIKMLNTHKITTVDKDEMKNLLEKYKKIKVLTEKLQHEINRLPGQSLKELDILLEDNLLREQDRLYNIDPANRLEPRHLGDIDISIYLSSLLLTCENIPKVKREVNDKKIYETLSWFCYSLEDQYHFGINNTKIIIFIKAVIEKDEETIKQQLYRLSKNNWDHSKRTF